MTGCRQKKKKNQWRGSGKSLADLVNCFKLQEHFKKTFEPQGQKTDWGLLEGPAATATFRVDKKALG
jgi:hypothetical protein